MTDAKDVGIVLWRVSNVDERCHSVVAGEFKDMCRILDDIDVDVTALERVYTSTSVHRIFILRHLNNVVELVRIVLIAT